MTQTKKTFLPITLDITDKTILLVGNGKSAWKKMRILQRFTQQIVVLANDPIPELKADARELIQETYHPDHLEGKYIVYASTDDLELDTQIQNDCHERKILVNVHDRPDLCDFVSPAVYQNGNVTVSVGSNATDVFLSIELRDKIKAFLEREVFQQNNNTL